MGLLHEMLVQQPLDAIVDSEKDQPTAISGCVDVTDEAISKLQ